MLVLPANQYFLLKELINKVPINNLFARSVIEKHVTGTIYVDDLLEPRTVYVIHPYGISLLFGDYKNTEFNSRFKAYALNNDKSRTNHEWLQTYPREWDKVLEDLFTNYLLPFSENTDHKTTGIVELHHRVNFRFNKEAYLKVTKATLSNADRMVETEAHHFEQIKGSVIPSKFWDSASDFLQKGKGFTLLHHGEIASTAYSAFVHDNLLEIGIETGENFRGHGFAELTCCKLIDYCLEKELIPVWSCRFENTASYKLAMKLGFEPTLMMPFYRLSN